MFSKIGLKISSIIMVALLIIVLPLGFLYGYVQGEKEKKNIMMKAKRLTEVGSVMISQYLAEAVHSEILTEAQVFDTNYIKIPGFNPPKYQTEYSTYTDRVFLKPQDSFLNDSTIEYAVALDKNGYLPTHNTRFQKALTFDEKKDIKGNRTKRFYKQKKIVTPIGAESVPIIEYKSDNGETLAEVTSPVTVLGKDWGIFTIGVNFKTLKKFKRDKILSFFIYTFSFIVITGFIVFIIVGVYVSPIRKITEYTNALSTGKTDMDLNVKQTKDEHGDLVASILRMRDSYEVTKRKFLQLRQKMK